ncbi:MAG: carboxypeptidase-like regulatory domain-containing protein, partial [Candidatus Marinimicrobia bacterium]|nr:carboxypeptidase-like regulatory domain-containing protein [Candidatus Neomarinimicrobiota bacterium]
MKKSIGIFLILNLSFAIAQSISGTVTDENGNGLAGANVTVDGTNMGAAADASGSYSINGVSTGSYTVSASFIGYNTASKSVNVGSEGATVNFPLASSALSASEVSVIGSRFSHAAQDQAVPVDVFTAQEIRRAGFSETAQILQSLAPSFSMPRTTIADGSDAVRPMTLR